MFDVFGKHRKEQEEKQRVVEEARVAHQRAREQREQEMIELAKTAAERKRAEAERKRAEAERKTELARTEAKQEAQRLEIVNQWRIANPQQFEELARALLQEAVLEFEEEAWKEDAKLQIRASKERLLHSTNEYYVISSIKLHFFHALTGSHFNFIAFTPLYWRLPEQERREMILAHVKKETARVVMQEIQQSGTISRRLKSIEILTKAESSIAKPVATEQGSEAALFSEIFDVLRHRPVFKGDEDELRDLSEQEILQKHSMTQARFTTIEGTLFTSIEALLGGGESDLRYPSLQEILQKTPVPSPEHSGLIRIRATNGVVIQWSRDDRFALLHNPKTIAEVFVEDGNLERTHWFEFVGARSASSAVPVGPFYRQVVFKKTRASGYINDYGCARTEVDERLRKTFEAIREIQSRVIQGDEDKKIKKDWDDWVEPVDRREDSLRYTAAAARRRMDRRRGI